jgi:uncharacterized protein (DUF427 family)
MKVKRLEPKFGQESVWDYPRPPRMEDVTKGIVIIFNSLKIAESLETKRRLETSHPLVYYVSPRDIKMTYLLQVGESSFCEWKGRANYYSRLVNKNRAERVDWCYPESLPNYKD